MGQFQVEKKKDGSQLTIGFKGNVDEDAILNNVTFEGANQIVLDLQGITAINSCGIREWIKWLKAAPASSKIIYKNCPKIIVDQINMVAGFLPANGEVDSFFVPYFNENSGNEKMVLFRKGVEVKEGALVPPEVVKDENGEAMEMDVIESKYFKFLKK